MDEVRWIERPDDLDALVAELLSEPAFALDTEFHRERTYWPQLALVQVAWPAGIALVDPLAVDVAPMRPLFESGATVVLHAADQDIEILERSLGTVPVRMFDTQVAAGFLGYSSASLGSLASALLDIELTKGDRLTDWLQRPLTDDQRVYAAADVAHLLEMKDILTEKLEARGRLQWVDDECRTLIENRRRAQDPETAWWRIKEARQLRGKARGVAQEVAAWREHRAMEVDRPPRSVLPDLGVVGVANRPPKRISDLGGIRGLEGRRPSGATAEALMAAVERGLVQPADKLRLPNVDEVDRGLRPAVGLVSAWVSQLARDLSIDAALLATRSDLEALLRDDPDARLANGWRAELVGRPVKRLVAGQAALAFEGGGQLVLEERSHRPITLA
ncbi:MAG TPA: HRDC domain-containing protein [Acidimicrobiales bacterium]|nr:HRDC domain-containing protein [Acidimicrobiales bacterium]